MVCRTNYDSSRVNTNSSLGQGQCPRSHFQDCAPLALAQNFQQVPIQMVNIKAAPVIYEIWQDHSYLSCMDGIALGCLTALSFREVVGVRLILPFQWFGRNSYEVYLTYMFFVTFFVGTPFMDRDGVLAFSSLPTIVFSGIFP